AGVWLRLRESKQPLMSEPAAIIVFLAVTTATIYLTKYVLFVALFMPAATLVIDHALHSRGVLYRLFSLRPLRFLGNISYSFYLLQPVGLLIARTAIAPLHLSGYSWLLALVVSGFAATIALASASFALLERPYFRFRHYLEPRPEQAAEPVLAEESAATR